MQYVYTHNIRYIYILHTLIYTTIIYDVYKTNTTTMDEMETGLPPGDHTRAAARGIGAPTSTWTTCG